MSSPTAGAYEVIRQQSLARIERERLDPACDLDRVSAVVSGAVEDWQRRAHLGGGAALRDPGDMASRVLRSITDYGALSDLFARGDIEEVFIEGDRVTYIGTDGRLHGLTVPTTEEENRQVVDRLLASTERHLDTASPLVQARVLEGSARLTAAIPPVADRLSATVRRQTLRRDTLESLLARGSIDRVASGFLHAIMQGPSSVIVSGPPGAGKTSLLAALLAAAPSSHCIRCCEEIRELAVPLPHGSFYETRPPGLDGTREITLRDLVKFVLAMRPDRIVVGEVRGAEAFELTRAVNAGCGFACTVHANSARDALDAVVNAAVMAGENVGEGIVRKVFASAIDFVVHCDMHERPGEGLRREVVEILALVPSLHEDFSTEPILRREAPGAPLEWTGALPPRARAIERYLSDGATLTALLEGRVRHA